MPDSLLGNSVSDLFGDRGATISDCGRYRYRLWRRWGDGPTVLFVMLNPSTAGADLDDPTIRRCIGFARSWGAGRLDVVNLYAWRATKPTDLRQARGPVGEFPWSDGRPGQVNRNDVEIEQAVGGADRTIAAWGAWPGPIDWRPARVMDLLGERVEALALTKDGSPRHPLYVRGDVEPTAFREANRAA